MKINIFIVLIAVFIAGMGVGCQSPRTAGTRIQINARDMDPRIVYNNQNLARAIIPTEVVCEYNESNFLVAQVEISSLVKRDTEFEYKYDWFDENGLQILPGKGIYRKAVVHGGDFIRLSGIAPTDKAVAFKINIR